MQGEAPCIPAADGLIRQGSSEKDKAGSSLFRRERGRQEYMDVYTARQPIFDKSKSIFAYELLFRGGTANLFPNVDGDLATSRVLSNTFFTSGIEQTTGGKKAFVNFTRDLLLDTIPQMFPADKTVIELLEDVEPEDYILSSCKELLEKGYILALDDFIYHPRLDPLIAITPIIKIDFRRHTPEELKDYVNLLIPRGKRLVAMKIENYEEFNRAVALGFSYFQGYFFSKPQLMVRKDIPSLKLNMLQIMAEANKDDFSLHEMKRLIERDVGISFKLLRYLNSPFFRRPSAISSIQHAIVLLGETGVRRFLSVIMLSEMIADKPDELLKSAIIRARMCEQMGRLHRGTGANPSVLFTLGLFSHIDAMLDNPMTDIVAKLPLAQNISDALLGVPNMLRDYLDLAVSYAQGDWEVVQQKTLQLNLDPSMLPTIYQEAITWADALYTTG